MNIDHVATLRNARGGTHPDILRAAELAVQSGADSITVHLREDRRHIRDDDVKLLKQKLSVPMNLEIALNDEMVQLALAIKPHAVCLVPERREELTTEGGLNVSQLTDSQVAQIVAMNNAGIRVCAFIEPSIDQINAAKSNHIRFIELHTGPYCHADGDKRAEHLARIRECAEYAVRNNIECHAGHGLNYNNVAPIAGIPQIMELNIGHFLVGEALFTGLGASIRHMRFLMDNARMTQS